MCIEELKTILGRVCANPSNPSFNHYLFETIASLVRYICAATPTAVDAFEGMLFPPFQQVLQADIAEFTPYVFQAAAPLAPRAHTPHTHTTHTFRAKSRAHLAPSYHSAAVRPCSRAAAQPCSRAAAQLSPLNPPHQVLAQLLECRPSLSAA